MKPSDRHGVLTSNWTTTYREIRDTDHPYFLPVRISVGLPRWWHARAKSFPYLEDLAPVGLRNLEGRELVCAYCERLDAIGPEAIQKQFFELWDTYCKPLVLLCFEKLDLTDLTAFDPACHRRIFARWWHEKTGQLILEADALNPLAVKKLLAR